MAVVDQRAEDGLADVVTARRELVEHDVLPRNAASIPIRRLLQLVEGAGREHRVGDAPPVEPWIDGGAGLGTAAALRLCGGRHLCGKKAAGTGAIGVNEMWLVRGASGSRWRRSQSPARGRIFRRVLVPPDRPPRDRQCPSCTS